VTNPALTKEFLFYYLLTEQLTQTLLRFQNRTGMPKVNRDELMCMYIPVPSLDEQEAICSKLSEIDNTIEAQKSALDSAFQLSKSLINQIL
jgi:type I restriction enzyme S subunit